MYKDVLIQVNNRNMGMNLPLITDKSVQELRSLYGEKIEGETVSIYDFNSDIQHRWIYKNGQYIEDAL